MDWDELGNAYYGPNCPESIAALYESRESMVECVIDLWVLKDLTGALEALTFSNSDQPRCELIALDVDGH